MPFRFVVVVCLEFDLDGLRRGAYLMIQYHPTVR
jgi:hypothetical protein